MGVQPPQQIEISLDDQRLNPVVAQAFPDYSKLYVRGRVEALSPLVGIVGARLATPYGIKAAQLVATWAVEAGFGVVSGGARGCDQAAHRGALEGGGMTVAVMGCGADVAYPKRADALLEQIAQTGAIASLYPWGTHPLKYRFVERNRLIAALSSLLVVVEAGIPSGTFSTVDAAAELGTPIAAIPGSIFSPSSAGPNRLLSEGAHCLVERDDFLAALELIAGRSPDNRPEISLDSIAPLEAALRSQPLTVEEIARRGRMTIPEALVFIERLVCQEKITPFDGGRFMIVNKLTS